MSFQSAENDYLEEPEGPEGYVTEEQAETMFTAGLQAMREMLARFVEQGGNAEIATSLRLNWNPSWGTDPGRPAAVQATAWDSPDPADTVDYIPTPTRG